MSKAILVTDMPEDCGDCIGDVRKPDWCPLRPMTEEKDEYIEKLESEIEKYHAIGTVEECRAAMGKTKPKKMNTKVNDRVVVLGRVVFTKGTKVHYCPECNRPVTGVNVYCRNCGQALLIN